MPGTINNKYSSDTFENVVEFHEGLIYSFNNFRELMNKQQGLISMPGEG
ncbi:hypothetical protein [Peribacillus sp. YIM B13477]